MSGNLKLFAEGGHQLVDKWLAIVSDNILRHATSVDDMVQIKSMTFSFLTSLSGIASAHLEK